MTQIPAIPFLDYQESRTSQGIKATVRLEKVLWVTMPSGYDSRGKYQIMTSYESTKGREVELDEEQARRGRILMSKLEEKLKKQMKQAGWREAQRTDGKPLVGKNGSVIWEFGVLTDFPMPATDEEQLADLQRQLAEQADLIEKLSLEKADLESQLDQLSSSAKRQSSGGEVRTYKVYGSAEARLKAEKNGNAPLFTRSVRMHTVTFTCAICGRERTEEHLPGQKPTVCSEPGGVKTRCQRAAARLYTARSRERKAKQQAKL